ncbi:flagellar hook-length control protein FliK, partial [Pseudomonas stutzeri]|nr:flagellar hook-length control protein FliK [Stutzerimonas stutzeri]
MAVSPDLLLKSPTVDARPKAATKAPDTPRDGRDNGNASFSDVYAKERQAKPVDRPARNDGARDKSVEDKGRQEAAGATSDEKPAVAESGNTLPAETVTDEAPDSELDPLLLLGLGAQLVPAEDVQPATDAGGETLLSGLPVAQPSIAAAIDQ